MWSRVMDGERQNASGFNLLTMSGICGNYPVANVLAYKEDYFPSKFSLGKCFNILIVTNCITFACHVFSAIRATQRQHFIAFQAKLLIQKRLHQ